MKTKVIILMALIMGIAGSAYGQAAPDSIAVCPPGEPAEMIVVAPEDVVAPEAKATGSDNGSRLMTVEEIAVATDSIVGNYDSEWTELTMQGKLSFDGLPMAVSVKVYMKRGESIILSARAPFFGEVARVETNQDSICFINKHTRCYNTQPLQGYGVDPKAYLTDLQDVLIGQVAFPGHGRLSSNNSLQSQWISLPTSETLIYPGAELQTVGTEYGFVLDPEWQLQSFVLMLQNTGAVLETRYLYGEKGWTLGLEISLPKKKKMQGEVELSYPDYDGTPLEFTKHGGKYRKVDFKQLLRF